MAGVPRRRGCLRLHRGHSLHRVYAAFDTESSPSSGSVHAVVDSIAARAAVAVAAVVWAEIT